MADSDHAVLVSILSPVYNESAHIEEMINSVLAQSHTALELIIVDDGSTDDTVEIACRAGARDDRVKVIDEGKLGKVRAFNRAFEESEGEVIVLMGGDDVMPSDSIATRAAAVQNAKSAGADRVAAFARLRTFSMNPKFDGQVIPRSNRHGARSGGTLAMSRELAVVAFPIPEDLVAEDLWVGGIASAVADAVAEVPDVVLHYRIHEGNSNPRNQDFTSMTRSMHARMLAYHLLAEQPPTAIPARHRERFAMLANLEEKRFAGDLLGVLMQKRASMPDRLRTASMTVPLLFRLRSLLFKLFSGW